MNLYEGIYERQSIRRYRMEGIDTKIINNILKYASQLESLSGNCRTGFRILAWQNIKKHRMGIFSVKAPYYLVLFCDSTEEAMLNAGYLLGQLDLYMVSRGLGTCFFHGAKKLCAGENGMSPMMALAFGKVEPLYGRSIRRTRRLPFSELCIVKEEIGKEEKAMLEAARLAPSSFNSQPWRFVAYDGRIHLFCKREGWAFSGRQGLHYLNMGIVLAYLFVAAEEFWYSPEAVRVENILEKQLKRNEYVVTVRFK